MTRINRTSLLLGLLLALSVSAPAAPFLVCDPYPVQTDTTLNPVSFVIKGIGGNPISSQAFTQADGSVILHYDLATLPNGKYTVTVDAINVFGGDSGPSSPFPFVKGAPPSPTNLRISPS
jgi:hypothetical protein